ncbi:carbon-nitrogen hydrolase family protein [Massilia sp. PAMC28688]|uniref:carbon-nitrogen hydrolase family protein n=1 Tax=Massilia sp. PAMC28688 TaxID=2861283 RepID=UPI001E5B3B23|nr:carbon-nitrogen hydrolase family protein [Massilia sp. PAMC28688]
MSGLRIAAAQSHSVDGDIAANLARHLLFIEAAAQAKTGLLVFPELSLTGYLPQQLAELAVTPDDPRFADIRAAAACHGMTIVVGAPLASAAGKPHIGVIAFHPGGHTSTYRKHFLYQDEERYAAPGSAISQVIDVRAVPVALAVCYDVRDQRHPHAAVMAGATIYAAGSVVTPGGIEQELATLRHYASLFSMGILFANHARRTGAFDCAGRSSIWLPDGQLLVQAPGQGECLVTGDEDNGAVIAVAT